MKIGIMTFWWSKDNYGQLLQCYALQTYLRNLGHDVFVIKYDDRNSPSELSFWEKTINNLSFSKILKKAKSKISSNKEPQILPDRSFDSFRDKYFIFSENTYTTYKSLKLDPPQADFYICGSDQIWNYQLTKLLEPFFLQFGNDQVKRLAYAASIGHKNLPDKITQKMSVFLNKFTAVGVREKSAVEICKKSGFYNAKWVIDPTMLLTLEHWKTLIPENFNQKKTDSSIKKKAFVYTLGNRPLKAKEEVIGYIVKMPDIEIQHSSINNDNTGKIYPTIEEWLGYFSSSDIVVTNSFHGIIFCILFNKRFIALPSKGSTAGMNERMDSLLEKCELLDRILFDYSENEMKRLIEEKINWDKVNKNINEWRQESYNYLKIEKYV